MKVDVVSVELAARFDTLRAEDLIQIKQTLPLIDALVTELTLAQLRELAVAIIPTDMGMIHWLRALSVAPQDITAAISAATADRLALYIAMAAPDILPHITTRRIALSAKLKAFDADATAIVAVANKMRSDVFRNALRTWPHRYEDKLSARATESSANSATS